MGTDKAWRRALRGHYCLSSALQVTWTSHCAGPVLSTYPLTADKYSLVTICTMLRPVWMYLGVLSCTISLGNPKKQFPIESITASILTVKETEAQGYWAVCSGLHRDHDLNRSWGCWEEERCLGGYALASLESLFTEPHHLLRSRSRSRDWDFVSWIHHPQGYILDMEDCFLIPIKNFDLTSLFYVTCI